jgi:signal transduction histidine kinase
MYTRSEGQKTLKVAVDWVSISRAKSVSQCSASISAEDAEPPIEGHGTRVTVFDLKSAWNDEQFAELSDYLSRLISPFRSATDFEIWLTTPGDESKPVQIQSTAFLDRPKYRIVGELGEDGRLNMAYTFTPVPSDKPNRKQDIEIEWKVIKDSWSKSIEVKLAPEPPCGPFKFEIRAWDIGVDDVSEIVDRFQIRRGLVREAIRAHKGISVYRDEILVLPKSDSSRDWLGLDLRRVSDLGPRLSTSQIIGYVAISGQGNPHIKDTSDRERLVQNPAVNAFEDIIKNVIVRMFEKEREIDRVPRASAEKPLRDLFSGLKPAALKTEFQKLVRDNRPVKDAEPIIDQFSRDLDEARTEIERRFVYYSRLATIGTLAQMMVHEVLSRTTTVGQFLSLLEKDAAGSQLSATTIGRLGPAQNAVRSLAQLANTFLPLSGRSFGRGKRQSVLEERISQVLVLSERDFRQHAITPVFKATGNTLVAVDPAELEAVLINLVSNAVYWVSRGAKSDRTIEIRVRRDHPRGRVTVGVHDTGPGIVDEEPERIFWPGVTKKPDGFGMGLTIVSEIVDAYGGKTGLIQPGLLDGASFEFDLPLAN